MAEYRLSATEFRREQKRADNIDTDLWNYLSGKKNKNGDFITLQYIMDKYGVGRTVLMRRIEDKAIENEEWAKIYIDFQHNRQRKSYRNVDFVPAIVDMIINERSIRQQGNILGVKYETFRDIINSIKENDELFPYIVAHKKRKITNKCIKLEFDEKKSLEEELKEYLNRRQEPEKKKTPEEYVCEMEEYLGKINPDTSKRYTKEEIAKKLGIAAGTLRKHYASVKRDRTGKKVNPNSPPPGGDDR